MTFVLLMFHYKAMTVKSIVKPKDDQNQAVWYKEYFFCLLRSGYILTPEQQNAFDATPYFRHCDTCKINRI